MSLTATDIFCGAGGSSLGAEKAGVSLELGLNHWRRAIETHSHNFPDADHECADVAALTTERIRNYPDTDLLLASPECTEHSLAKGAKARANQAPSLFDDGPAGSEEAERSRATMWDVPRFLEMKQLKGKPYKAIVVENVTDALRWGPGKNGATFRAWLQVLNALDYEYELVFLNSMMAPPTPQSRDRMYVVLWQKGMRKPDLQVRPTCYCPHCAKVVDGVQAWKRNDPAPWFTTREAKFGRQYFYACPDCHKQAIPGAAPAASALDFTLPAQRIGDRKRPLAEKTMGRIRRGLERLSSEPFAIRLLHSGAPKPLTLPCVTLTQRHDMAMVFPVAGNTHEARPGNRARDARTQPVDTIHGTLERAIVIPMRKNTTPPIADQEPCHTMTSGGFQHSVVISNYGPGGGNKDPEKIGGWERDGGTMPFGTITAQDGHSLVLPYYNNGDPQPVMSPSRTVTTKDRLALLVPEILHGESDHQGREWTEQDIDDCTFRMFSLPEIARVMSLDTHCDGEPYVVHGNKREQMAQYGNAVTSPVMELLVSRLMEVC